jgi:hypothetical protein
MKINKAYMDFDDACRDGNLEVVKQHIANISDNGVRSGLRTACIHNKLNVMKYLISCGGAINPEDILQVSIQQHTPVAVVKYLLDCGAKLNVMAVNHSTTKNVSALRRAEICGNVNVVEYIKSVVRKAKIAEMLTD